MNKLAGAFYSVVITLWVGGLFTIGAMVTPVLFDHLADHTQAGNLAATLFTLIALFGMACAGYLEVFLILRRGWRVVQCSVFWIVLTMLALSAVQHFGIQPVLAQLKADALPRQVMESPLANKFATGHGISMVLYAVETLLGFWLVIWQERGKN